MYSQLAQAEDLNFEEANIYFFQNINLPSLIDEEKELYEGHITLGERTKVLVRLNQTALRAMSSYHLRQSMRCELNLHGTFTNLTKITVPVLGIFFSFSKTSRS